MILAAGSSTGFLIALWWSALVLVLYAFAGYPLWLWLAVRMKRRAELFRAAVDEPVSIVIAAHNEERQIVNRLKNLLAALSSSGRAGEIVVVSDASTDRTVELAREMPGVRVLELARQSGKAAALNLGCASVRHDLIVFADVRQRWDERAIDRLVRNFADPSVGGVTGDLVIETADGAVAGVGLYWRYEKLIRRLESKLHSSVGATGAISAVRRSLFQAIPAGLILDDVYWPVRVSLAGYRVIHDPTALAFDRLPQRIGDEFRRKLRTLSGCFQLARVEPRVLLPWKNPICVQFWSHKLLRLAVPWALLALLLASALVDVGFYRLALFAQAVGYLWGLAGFVPALARRLPLSGALAGFLALNAAAWLAFWVWILGRAGLTWTRVEYTEPIAKATQPSLSSTR